MPRDTLHRMLDGIEGVADAVTQDRNTAVRAALKDAHDKGKLEIAALLHGIPEEKLLRYLKGDSAALTDFELEWLAVDLRS